MLKKKKKNSGDWLGRLFFFRFFVFDNPVPYEIFKQSGVQNLPPISYAAFITNGGVGMDQKLQLILNFRDNPIAGKLSTQMKSV